MAATVNDIARSYGPYFYTCAGCGRKRNKYIGEMYINKLDSGSLWLRTLHKYCCSEKCYYFTWLKYVDVIDPFYRNNPQLFTEPEVYVEF